MFKTEEEEQDIGFLQYEHVVNSDNLEVVEETLVDVDNVEEVIGSSDGYNFVDMKESEPVFINTVQKRKYRMRSRPQAATYYCTICNKHLRYPSKIREHMRKHTGEKPYACHICSARFSQAHVLKDHLRSHQGEKPYKCSFCDRCFVSIGHKNLHEKSHFRRPNVEVSSAQSPSEGSVISQVFMCPVENCGFQNSIGQVVEEHINMVHCGDNDWTDEYIETEYDCEQQQDLIQDDEYHYFDYEMKPMTEQSAETNAVYDNSFFCQEAVPPPTEEVELFSIETTSSLLKQEPPDESSVVESVEYSIEGPSTYEECAILPGSERDEEIMFDGEERVRVWIDPHPPRKGRQNPVAPSEIPAMEEVVVDARVLEMVAPKRYPAYANRPSRAKKPARNLDWIIDAVAKGHDVDLASPHNRRKPKVHVCLYCGKTDKYPSKILAHQRTHTGEKPYTCDICGMAFAQRTPLRLHIRRHLNQKPYVCSFEGCAEEFVSGALLNLHMEKKHLKRRKYVCIKGCGRFFASARNQRYHEERCLYNKDIDTIYQDCLYDGQQSVDRPNVSYVMDGLVMTDNDVDTVSGNVDGEYFE